MIALRRRAIGGGSARWEPRQAMVPVAAALAAAGLGVAVVEPSLVRVVLLVSLLVTASGLALWSPTALLYSLSGWLVVLGLVRRLVDTTANATSGGLGDPLLLVEPGAMVLLTAVALQKGAFQGRTRLANAVLLLNVLALVEVANPLQGSPLVGAAGLLFLLVPMLAFWVGRSLVNDRVLRNLLVLIAVLAVPAVVYGLFQQLAGMPSWDQAWITAYGYTALTVGGTVRSFGPFTSAAEYATFIAIALVTCAAGLARPRFALLCLITGGLLGFGLFYESSRGIVVLAVLALAVMWAARSNLRPGLALLAGVAGVALLFLVAHSAASAPVPAQASAGSALAQHQIQGLANPLNTQDSTLLPHVGEMLRGLRDTITEPFGQGSGSISLAAASFGGRSQGTELDPSNFGVALGLPGLLAYLVVVAVGMTAAYRLAATRRQWWTAAALGLLVVTFFQWSNGGQYAVAWLPWLVLGWVDRSHMNLRDQPADLLSTQPRAIQSRPSHDDKPPGGSSDGGRHGER
ncbi:MAG: hypothetical protein ACRD0Z_01260 [Acidimicrobiales bacterium]